MKHTQKELYAVFRREPQNERESEIMSESLNDSDERKGVIYEISDAIKGLKNRLSRADKQTQYNSIATGIYTYIQNTATTSFKRKLIKSFFDVGDFPTSTERKHVKSIIDTLKNTGIIADDKNDVQYTRFKVGELGSNDGESYFSMMKYNGYTTTNYFIFKKDKNNFPRRFLVATSNINGLPKTSDGDLYEGKIDLSILKQTLPREKQQVKSYGNKSIMRTTTRGHKVKNFKVIA